MLILSLVGALRLLDDGAALLGLVVGFVVGIVLRAAAEALAADRAGDRQARLARRLTVEPRRHLDPFGVVAFLITGVGWPAAVPLDQRRLGRGRFLSILALGPAVHLLLGLVAFAAARLIVGGGEIAGPDFAAEALLVAGLVNVGCAVLALVPLPPLEGSRALWALAPRSASWERLRYWSEEQGYGVAVLVILILPIFGSVGLIMRLVYEVGRPLVDLMLRTVGMSS